jgi:tRNA nucleotidyltransferase (CCA-adding enzyme)
MFKLKALSTISSTLSHLSSAQFIKDLQSDGGIVYEVGGSVRDTFLGQVIKDRDLVVARLPLNAIQSILKRHGKVSLVGKSFGVIKFDSRELEQQFDIALPRKERSTGTGHRDFKVDFDPDIPIEDDLSRRDFTINAMARDISSETLIDPFYGYQDLENKLIRTVTQNSFMEDPLRLMRAIQFAARFQLEIEDKTFQAMKQHCQLINTVSAERICEELVKLLKARKPSKGFVLMHETGLLQEVLPEVEATIGVEQGNKFLNDDVFKHTMRVLDASRQDVAIDYSGNLDLMLSALYHDVGKTKTKRVYPEENKITFYGHQIVSRKIFQKRFKALKMTHVGANLDDISCMIENHMFQTKSFFSDKAIRRFVSKIGKELILKLVDLRIADNRGGKYPDGIKGILKLKKRIVEEISKESPFGIRDLAVTGHELMEMGIPEGPVIGNILKHLVEVVLDEPKKNDKETLINIVKSELA